jgi:hypothetical protein
VVVHRGEDGLQIELVGDIVRMVELGRDGKQAALPEEAASSVKVVAGDRNHLYRTSLGWARLCGEAHYP